MQLMYTIIILIMIAIFLVVFVPALLKTFSGNLDFIHKILGTSDYEKAFREASDLEKYIVCVYETCKEGINNEFCSDSRITPYNTLLDKAYEYLDASKPIKICGESRSFPLAINFRSGTEVSKENLYRLSYGKIKCISSEPPAINKIYIDEDLFKINAYDTECSHGISKAELKNDEKLYIYVDSDYKIPAVRVTSTPPYPSGDSKVSVTLEFKDDGVKRIKIGNRNYAFRITWYKCDLTGAGEPDVRIKIKLADIDSSTKNSEEKEIKNGFQTTINGVTVKFDGYTVSGGGKAGPKTCDKLTLIFYR